RAAMTFLLPPPGRVTLKRTTAEAAHDSALTRGLPRRAFGGDGAEGSLGLATLRPGRPQPRPALYPLSAGVRGLRQRLSGLSGESVRKGASAVGASGSGREPLRRRDRRALGGKAAS